MRVLGFDASRGVRRATFAERSLLPIAAACLVGNAVRETLAALLRASVSVELLEPVVPSASAWPDLLRDARTVHVRGSVAEGALVLRPRDARVLAAAAFGERSSGERLSPLERIVLERLLTALAPALVSVCGADLRRVGESPRRAFTTYFEAIVERPDCRIGIALSREAPPPTLGALRPGDLADVPVELHAVLGEARVTAGELLALQPGVTLPMTSVSGGATLLLEGRPVARGMCGVRAGHFAILVGEDSLR